MVTEAPIDLAVMKLGKQPSRHDPRTLRLEAYLTPEALPPIPKTRRWSAGLTSFGMMGNDRLGDCTCAAIGHAIQTWTADNGNEVTVTDADVEAVYWATGTEDNGRVILDVLKYCQNVGMGGHKIGPYMSVNPQNKAMVHAAIDLFGGVNFGVALPLSAQNQRVWSVVRGPNGAPGSWGGHSIWTPDYTATRDICVTWAALQAGTEAFWERYADECWVILSPDWTDGSRPAPSGFNLDQLMADLQAVLA